MIKPNKHQLFTTIIFLIASSCSASNPISEIEQFSFKANLSQDWVLTNKTISYLEKPYDISLTYVKNHVTLQISQAKCSDCKNLMANFKSNMAHVENGKAEVISFKGKDAVLSESLHDYKKVKMVVLQTASEGLYHKISFVYSSEYAPEKQKKIRDEFDILVENFTAKK